MPSSPALLLLLPYVLSAAISAGVAGYCWRRRARPGVAAFALLAGSEAFWTMGFLFELASRGLRGKLFWDNLQYLPLALIPVGFLAFAHGFSGRTPRHPRRVYAVLALPLLAVAVLAFTDPLHGLIRAGTRPVAAPLAPLEYGFTGVLIAAAAYIYLLQGAAIAVLAAAGWTRTHPLYRAQVNVVIAGLLVPTLGSVLTLTVLADSPFRDLTPYTFALGNLVIAWGLFRRGLFDVVPLARHAVVESLSDAVYVLDAAGRVVDLNPAARRASGRDDGVGRPAREVLPLPAGLAARLHENGAADQDVDGGAGGGAVHLGVHPLHGPHGEPWGSVVVLRDIAERKRAEAELRRSRDQLEAVVGERTAALVTANAQLLSEIAARREAGEALRASEESLRQIAENSSEIFWLLELDRSVAYLSPAFERMWGMQPGEIRADAYAALRTVAPEHRDAVRAVVDDGYLRPSQATYRVVHPGGTERWLQTRTAPVLDEHGAVYRVAGVTADVTERKRMEDQLLHDAFHDGLTGLPNRALFQDRLQHSLELSRRRPDRGFAVMILDLDRFKLVNDSLGHLSGDRLLASVADRLRAAMRDGDTVARFGGDEFALLLDDVPDAGEALRGAERIRAGLAGPFALEGHELFVTPSIGIALSGPEVERPEDMVRRADTAMYRAKELGGARSEVFDRAMHARALSRLRLETELRRALERGELEAAYQPIIALPGGHVAGFEALVRWRHPQRGLLAPGAFLEVAEETGLIVAIDRWMLREACTQLHAWRGRHPGRELRMTVNLSDAQFGHGGLVQFLEQTLADTGVDVDWVRLEITERALVGGAEEALLAELRARGVQMLIDDFGTGYSSLAHLHRLPISALKVDRSFLAGPEPNYAIVGAVVALSHNLGKDVVVEGVERADQLARLLEMGADYAQGYLFSPPVDAHAAEPLISRRFSGEGWAAGAE
ncbi:MAG TPA: EAL domain-containing protein [Longimicrobium sp.]|nr:EAL domain-containing protein [Longimicrobium sp.]